MTNARYEVIEEYPNAVKVRYKGIGTTGYRRKEPDVSIKEGTIATCGDMEKRIESDGEIRIRHSDGTFASQEEWEDCVSGPETYYRTAIICHSNEYPKSEGGTIEYEIETWYVTPDKHAPADAESYHRESMQIAQTEIPFLTCDSAEKQEQNREVPETEVNPEHLYGRTYVYLKNKRYRVDHGNGNLVREGEDSLPGHQIV